MVTLTLTEKELKSAVQWASGRSGRWHPTTAQKQTASTNRTVKKRKESRNHGASCFASVHLTLVRSVCILQFLRGESFSLK